MKNWPDRNIICKNKIDFGINLKIKKTENRVKAKKNIFVLRINPDSIISFAKFGISGSFIKISKLLAFNKAKDIPSKIRLVRIQTVDMGFLLWISIFALFAIKIAAAGVAGSQ